MLCERFHAGRLDVFDSAGTDRFDPATIDVDFLVEFAGPAASYADDYFDLLHELETFLSRPVDLLIVERKLVSSVGHVNRLSKIDRATAARITDLPKIAGFRDVRVHGYAVVDDALVRQIVESSLPALLAEVDALLAASE